MRPRSPGRASPGVGSDRHFLDTPAAWLVNGVHLQLQLDAMRCRARPWHWSLHERRDGRELAAWAGPPPPLARLARQVPRPAWRELSHWLARRAPLRPDAGPRAWTLPAPALHTGLRERARHLCRQLALPPGTLAGYRLPACNEPGMLVRAGSDLAGRPLWLVPPAARAWQAMRQAAAAQGITLLPVSGYRSIDYQAGLVARKQARGLAAEQILRYSALPGHSEHHLGTVLDLHDGRGPPLEETFQDSPAFAWLRKHAGRYGFVLSYGRDNPWGIGYEPWHWRYLPAAAA